MASSQHHRCVYVGNIPYDTTEERLIEILQEVGPLVSFRLMKDKETAKPKGYGFCEYKDEETALSACRNLQGYEINGRKLRVDFADRNKKQVGAPEEAANNHQPVGLHIAITAATVMKEALGGHQNGLGHDPLTLNLAKLSRNQLMEIMSELKAMAMYNPESAHDLLLSRRDLAKALFQAEIMLGLVTPKDLKQVREEETNKTSDSELFSRPSKMIKLDDGIKYSSSYTRVTDAPFSQGSSHVLGSVSSLPVNATSQSEAPYSEQHFFQLPPNVQLGLLQQVLSLTTEQLSSLPREQQQQVLQLRQALEYQPL